MLAKLRSIERDIAWLSRESGVARATLDDYARRGITRAATAGRIADALGVTLDWLIAGRGDDAAALPSPESDEMIAVQMDGAAMSAGGGSLETEGQYQADWMFPRAWITSKFGNPDKLRLLPVRGDSMTPTLNDRDWAMLDRSQTRLSDGIFAILLDGELLVKRIQLGGREIRIISDNAAYEPIVVPKDEVDERIVVRGRIVWSS